MIKISIQEVLDIIPEIPFDDDKKHFVKFHGFNVDVNRARYFNFKKNGTNCEVCNTIGEYFTIDAIEGTDMATLTLYGTKDSEKIVISSVRENAKRPKFKVGTILCSDCIHTHIAHHKSNGYKDRKSEYEKYKEEHKDEELENSPFAELLKNFQAN